MKKIVPKMIRFSLTDPILHGVLTCFINYSYEEFKDCVNDKRVSHNSEKPLTDEFSDSSGILLPRKNYKNQMCYLLWMRKFDWSLESISTLTHELIHFTAREFEHRGIPFKAANDEVFAYYLCSYQTQALLKLKSLYPHKT
jgi:hypothetical protein